LKGKNFLLFLIEKGNKVYGLRIIYTNEEYNRSYALKITCDPIGNRDETVTFEHEGIENDGTWTFAATSYHGMRQNFVSKLMNFLACAIGKNYFEI